MRDRGRALLLSAFDSFARSGLSEARLDVATDNPRAMRLYDRVGMTPSHEAAVFEREAGLFD